MSERSRFRHADAVAAHEFGVGMHQGGQVGWGHLLFPVFVVGQCEVQREEEREGVFGVFHA